MEYVLLVVTGFCAGILGGLLGVGGSILMIPAMVFIFTDVAPRHESIHQYQAAAMIVNFLLIAPAVVRHARVRAIVVDVWKWVAPAALVGIVAGVAVSRLDIFTGANEPYMRLLFGAFLLYVAGDNAWKLLRRSPERRADEAIIPSPAWKKLAVGLPMGFSAGLLGIGGGIVAVPAMQMLLRLPLRLAIATSAATIVSVSWLGALAKNASLGADGSVLRSLTLAALLAPTAMIGGYLGGHLTHALPPRVLRIVFTIIMLVSAIDMLHKAAGKLGWI